MIGMTFNETHGIVEVIYKGTIEIDDLINFGKALNKNEHLPRQLIMLTDAREAKYNFTIKEIPIIIKSMQENTKRFEFVKAAFIQIKPKETAMSTVLENKTKTSNYYHKIFYTKESALKWLLSDSLQ